MLYSLSINTMLSHILELRVVAFFKTLLTEEKSFDLQSEIVHIGIFRSFYLATRDEFQNSVY